MKSGHAGTFGSEQRSRDFWHGCAGHRKSAQWRHQRSLIYRAWGPLRVHTAGPRCKVEVGSGRVP
eukprot:2502361-Pyramimonas_sp.AAC.1